MYKSINNINEFNTVAAESKAALFYFSHNECNVCKVLKPKIHELIQNEFNKIELYYVNIKEDPETAAQNRIFTVPTLLVFFEGREYIRKSRNIGINELMNDIHRPYGLLFE
ncbi:MAG: thioredoxin family protein [Chlorobi bacterium]|nr:thioredoxin family protein [Chlorobiota bacterium]